MALQKEKRKRYYSRVCIQYCKKLDQSVHNSQVRIRTMYVRVASFFFFFFYIFFYAQKYHPDGGHTKEQTRHRNAT